MSKIEINIEDYLNGEKKEKEVIWLWKEDGLHTDWYDNGQQKKSEVTYKDGKPEGLGTVWYESGQKKSETNFKNG